MLIFKTQKNKLLALAMLFISIFAANAQTPVEKYGQLKIFNGKVSDLQGNPVVLRGMSLFWSGYPEGSPFYNAQTIQELRDDWCVDVVRAAMSVETGNTNYVGNKSQELQKITTVIDACVQLGLYVVVDFHSHNAPNYMSQAKEFFAYIANQYGHLPNILYEPYNEPIEQSWSGTIKPYHEEIISTIRAIDPDNIIICGTRNYSQEVDEAANDPLTGTNIAYTLHYYAYSHRSSLRQKALNAMSKGIALFVTEYGTCHSSGNGNYDPAESQVWWDFLEEHQLSSCNWSVGNKAETSAILTPGTWSSNNWSSNQITTSGKLVKDYLSGKCNLVVATGSVTLSFTDDRTQFDIGEEVTIDAAATVANGTIAKIEFYSGSQLLGSDNSSPYSFSTSSLAPGGHNITARSIDPTGNFIAESPLYVINVVGASDVSTTGITDQFESDEQFSELTGGVNGTSCATATDAAATGVYWFEDKDPATAFEAIATRAGDGTLKYVISQAEASYNVVGFNFGEYCLNGEKQKYMLDLTANAVLNLTVTSPATNTESLDLKFQMKDADGTVLAFKNTVVGTDGDIVTAWYKHEIGFSKNHDAPDYVSLEPGSTVNFIYDFKEAVSVSNPNAPDLPTDINTDNSQFDFSQVTEIVIIPVNKEDTGPLGDPAYAPLAFTDQEIIFSGLTMGDPTLGENFCTTPGVVSTQNALYCQGEPEVNELAAEGVAGLELLWYSSATGGTATEIAPIPSTSVPGVIQYFVSQAVPENPTCEGPRTELDVTVQEAPTANAGEDQILSSAATADLVGSGSAAGTWTLVSGPTGVDVEFLPSSTTTEVTATGLTEVGDYVFGYTVDGLSPCPAVTDEVTVNISSVTAVNKASKNAEIDVYPNPVSSELIVDMSKIQGLKSVTLVDLAGKVIYEGTGFDLSKIDMSKMEAGMYILQINSGSENIVRTVMKK